MERSELANAAEWSDERRGHFCISRIEIMPYAAFLLPSNFCVSKIGLTAIRKPHLECRYQCASTFFRQRLISIDPAGNLFCCSLLPRELRRAWREQEPCPEQRLTPVIRVGAEFT